jgi:hypothetical protein
MRNDVLKSFIIGLNHESHPRRGVAAGFFCAQKLTPANQSALDPPPPAWRPSTRLDKVGIFSHRATASRPRPRKLESMPRSPMIVRTVPALCRALDGLRTKKATIALVPTMGARADNIAV